MFIMVYDFNTIVTLKDGKELPGYDDEIDLDVFYELYGNIKKSYIISDDPNEEVVEVPGDMRLSELYKRKIDEEDEE